jgi:hypothetical protein
VESIIQVASGDDDVVVAISGFGSASVGADRWHDLAQITGRSVFYLKYDAQEFPWSEELGVIWPPALYHEMKELWNEARKGAKIAAPYLASWLVRWAQAGRKILVVGFSLGGYLAWEAVRLMPDALKGQVELIIMSAALVDKRENWEGAEHLARLVNVFSYEDMALKHLYPLGVGDDETPAAGLGPLVISDFENVDNVDLTDLIGRDHLWGSANVPRLVRAALGCLWSHRFKGEMCPAFDPTSTDKVADISPQAAQRLYRWMVVDPEYWALLARGLDGDANAVHYLELLDAWSLGDLRLSALLDVGETAVTLLGSSAGRHTAIRNLDILAGMVKYWVSHGKVLNEKPE